MSKKDAYYFSHDSNAKDDPKCMVLIDQLGLEGYGIYWVLIETLRDQPDYKYPLELVPILARRYTTTAEKMITVVKNYSFFEFDNENKFFSLSLNERMSHLENKRAKASIAGKKSAEKRKKLPKYLTDVERMLNECLTFDELSKVKESIVNEIKVNKINFIDGILIIFCVQFFKSRNINFELVNKDKESSAIGKLLQIFKNKHKDDDSLTMLGRFEKYFEKVLNISDKWIFENCSPSIILLKFNDINTIINNCKPKIKSVALEETERLQQQAKIQNGK